jgi:hypothetical protein
MNYEAMKVKELKKYCKDNNIKNYSKLKKEDLIKLIKNNIKNERLENYLKFNNEYIELIKRWCNRYKIIKYDKVSINLGQKIIYDFHRLGHNSDLKRYYHEEQRELNILKYDLKNIVNQEQVKKLDNNKVRITNTDFRYIPMNKAIYVYFRETKEDGLTYLEDMELKLK